MWKINRPEAVPSNRLRYGSAGPEVDEPEEIYVCVDINKRVLELAADRHTRVYFELFRLLFRVEPPLLFQRVF